MVLSAGGSKGEFKFALGQYKFDSTQLVEGVGFANSHQDMETKYSSLRNKAHGSGVCYSETTSKVRQKVYEPTSVTLKNSSGYKIELLESSSMVYYEQPFNLGNSFRSMPIRSLWAEMAWAKNYRDGVSINVFVFNARNLKKDLAIDVLNRDRYSDQYKEQYNGTGLNLNTTFSGIGHIGVLREDKNTKDAIMLMDEDYIGSFSLTKRIAMEVLHKNETLEDEGWLPCCSGGWADMTYWDKKEHGDSTKGIFDCSCFKMPKAS